MGLKFFVLSLEVSIIRELFKRSQENTEAQILSALMNYYLMCNLKGDTSWKYMSGHN